MRTLAVFGIGFIAGAIFGMILTALLVRSDSDR